MDLEAQDVQYATLLSELVYRAAESKTEQNFQASLAALEQEMGTTLPNITQHKSGGQRYLVSESDAAIYVAFQGTRTPIDWLTNLTFFHGPFWNHKHSHHSSRSSSSNSLSSSNNSTCSARAHGGFLRRAHHAAISIDALQAAAAAADKRLVLTGHSLGGAVATLTTVRLLRALTMQQDLPDPRIRCISFATPAVANTDLLQEVAAAGWDRYITNIILPEDPVVPFVNLLLKAPDSRKTAAGAAASSSMCKLDVHNSSSTDSEASSRIMAGIHRTASCDSAASRLSLSRSNSWDSLGELQYSHDQQQQVLAVQAAAMGCSGWEVDFAQQQGLPMHGHVYAHAATGGTGSVAVAARSGSEELTSWLAAARAAVQRQRLRRRQQQQHLPRSLGIASGVTSSSNSSLSRLESSSHLAEPAAGCGDSLAAFTTRLEAAPAAVLQLLGRSCNSSIKCSQSGLKQQHHQLHSSAGIAAAAATAASLAPRQCFSLSKAGLTAFVTGALAAGVRCGAALAASSLLGSHLSLFGLIPAALTAPVALVAVHLVGKATIPVSHPLGQQVVMTGAGPRPASKPLKGYPHNAEGLNLQQLGGLFPGHRMIAYRRRMVALLQQGVWQ